MRLPMNAREDVESSSRFTVFCGRVPEAIEDKRPRPKETSIVILVVVPGEPARDLSGRVIGGLLILPGAFPEEFLTVAGWGASL